MRVLATVVTVANLGLLGGAGCSLTPPIPVAHVRLGPAVASPPQVLLALPSVCNASSGDCAEQHRNAVAIATRMSVEFGGYTMIDSDRVNLELRQRRERRFTSETSDSRTVEITGALWVDATPAEQREVLDSMAIDGLLVVKLSFSEAEGMSQRQQIRVAVELRRVEPAEVVWSSHCTAESGDHHSTAQAIDLATRCALEGALLR